MSHSYPCAGFSSFLKGLMKLIVCFVLLLIASLLVFLFLTLSPFTFSLFISLMWPLQFEYEAALNECTSVRKQLEKTTSQLNLSLPEAPQPVYPQASTPIKSSSSALTSLRDKVGWKYRCVILRLDSVSSLLFLLVLLSSFFH